jgi:hypothetical protein
MIILLARVRLNYILFKSFIKLYFIYEQIKQVIIIITTIIYHFRIQETKQTHSIF